MKTKAAVVLFFIFAPACFGQQQVGPPYFGDVWEYKEPVVTSERKPLLANKAIKRANEIFLGCKAIVAAGNIRITNHNQESVKMRGGDIRKSCLADCRDTIRFEGVFDGPFKLLGAKVLTVVSAPSLFHWIPSNYVELYSDPVSIETKRYLVTLDWRPLRKSWKFYKPERHTSNANPRITRPTQRILAEKEHHEVIIVRLLISQDRFALRKKLFTGNIVIDEYSIKPPYSSKSKLGYFVAGISATAVE